VRAAPSVAASASGGARSPADLPVYSRARSRRFNPACGAALRAVEPRQLQQVRVESPRGPSVPLLISSWAMQQGNFAMTQLDNGAIATDIDAHDDNAALTVQGYSIRQIETCHSVGETCVIRDPPEIAEANLLF
jgi:hypothetical protein